MDLLSIALDKILKLCFCFLFCELKLFHDSSYIQRQKYSAVILIPAHPASFAHNFVSGMQSFYFSESQDAIVL